MKVYGKKRLSFLLSALLLALLLLQVGRQSVLAFEDEDAASALWILINDARAHPVAALEKYGIDLQVAREKLGEDAWVLDLENGLPPLAKNPLLEASAAAHTQDMIDRAYFDYITLGEGWGVQDRILQQGYAPEAQGESIELLFFYLYMDPMEGAAAIFENMIRGEFEGENPRPSNIFNPRFTEMGVSFVSTQFAFDGVDPFNAYIVTVDFAAPVEKMPYLMGTISRRAGNDEDAHESAIQTVGGSWSSQSNFQGVTIVVTQMEIASWTWSSVSGTFFPDASGTFQVPITSGLFFALEIHDAVDDRFLWRRVDIGSEVNRWLDIVLP